MYNDMAWVLYISGTIGGIVVRLIRIGSFNHKTGAFEPIAYVHEHSSRHKAQKPTQSDTLGFPALKQRFSARRYECIMWGKSLEISNNSILDDFIDDFHK